MVHAGIGLIAAGLVLVGVVALNPLAGLWIHDAKELGLVRGLWRTYLSDLTRWGFLLIGLGILITSGASSLLERIDPFEQLSNGCASCSPLCQERFAPFSLGPCAFSRAA